MRSPIRWTFLKYIFFELKIYILLCSADPSSNLGEDLIEGSGSYFCWAFCCLRSSRRILRSSRRCWRSSLDSLILSCQLFQSSGRLLKFSEYTVKAYKNSIAYLKMFTPYLIMTKSDIESEGITFDASKIFFLIDEKPPVESQ